MAEEQPKKRGRGRPPKAKPADANAPAESEKPAPKRRAQTEMPLEGAGVSATPTIPEIETAADKYIAIRDKRCKMTPQEVTAKEELIALIHANEKSIPKNAEGETVYRYDDLIITLKPGKEKLEIKEQSEPE